MNANLIIGNLISFAAAVFTVMSSLSKTQHRIYLCQTMQCLLLAVASIFFNSYAGIVTLLACAARNYFAAEDKLTLKVTVFYLLFNLIFGLLFNNRGWIGGIVIAANMIYTVGMYRTKRELTIKANIALNLTLWIIYECFIIDIPSIISDGIGLFVTMGSMQAILKKRSG